MTREGEQTIWHARGSIYKISCQLLQNIGLAVKRPTWWAPTALRTCRRDLNSNLTIRGLIFPAHILEDFTSHQFQIASRAYLDETNVQLCSSQMNNKKNKNKLSQNGRKIEHWSLTKINLTNFFAITDHFWKQTFFWQKNCSFSRVVLFVQAFFFRSNVYFFIVKTYVQNSSCIFGLISML